MALKNWRGLLCLRLAYNPFQRVQEISPAGDTEDISRGSGLDNSKTLCWGNSIFSEVHRLCKIS